MQDAVAAAVLIVSTLLFFQVLSGKAVDSDFSLVSRRLDPAGFWSSLVQQCVAVSLSGVFAVAVYQTDWKKVYESTRPRRRG